MCSSGSLSCSISAEKERSRDSNTSGVGFWPPPTGGDRKMWDEHDTQMQNFKSQHLAMTNPSLAGVRISWMPTSLYAKFVSFWHENPGVFFSAHLCAGKWPCPVDRRTGGLGTAGLAGRHLCFSWPDSFCVLKYCSSIATLSGFLSPLGFYSQWRLLLFLFFCIW